MVSVLSYLLSLYFLIFEGNSKHFKILSAILPTTYDSLILDQIFLL